MEKDEGSEAGKKSQEKSNVLKEVNSIFDGYSVQEIDLIEKNIAKGK